MGQVSRIIHFRKCTRSQSCLPFVVILCIRVSRQAIEPYAHATERFGARKGVVDRLASWKITGRRQCDWTDLASLSLPVCLSSP